MRALGGLVLGLLSGCCCGGGLLQTDDRSLWKNEVLRAKRNPQSYAMEPGTVSLFSIDVTQPTGEARHHHFAVLWPQPALFEELMGCAPCVRQGKRPLVAMGRLPVAPTSIDAQMVKAGVPLGKYVSFASMNGVDEALEVPDGATATLRLVEHCPVEVSLHSGSVKVGEYGGVISVPKTQEESWLELEGADCVPRELMSPLQAL